MSPKRPGGLATIHEEATELSINVTINDKVGTQFAVIAAFLLKSATAGDTSPFRVCN